MSLIGQEELYYLNLTCHMLDIISVLFESDYLITEASFKWISFDFRCMPVSDYKCYGFYILTS